MVLGVEGAVLGGRRGGMGGELNRGAVRIILGGRLYI